MLYDFGGFMHLAEACCVTIVDACFDESLQH